MKVLQVLLVCFVASGSTFHLSYVLPNVDSWFVPNFLNGTFAWINRTLVEAELKAMENLPDLVDYYLYTQENPDKSQLLSENDTSSLRKSNFNPKVPTRIIIHGYQSSADLPVCTMLRDALLNKEPRNVICVDWGSIANRTYPTARYVAPSVGKDVATFIDFLCREGQMPMENLHIVGHSLGAHIAGIAGKTLKSSYNRTLSVINGCDPALPLFDYNDCSSRLCKTDAGFVETIQTNGGRLGFLQPIGAGAYYPNGGIQQPGCGVDLIGSCSHSRSYKYLAEAIALDDFLTMKCSSYRKAVLKRCGKTYSNVTMGSRASLGVKGIFYVPVNSKPAYGKGHQ